MGLKTIKTEHSNFSFKNLEGTALNKLVKWYLKEVDATIGVSHSCKEHFCLRAKVDPKMCFVIPNAVDTTKFMPNPSLRFPLKTINIVHVSRLAWNKGTGLLIDIIPEILDVHPNAYFIIGGDGVMKPQLELMVKKYNLEGHVEMLGAVPHADVPNVMNRG